ncbi:MAG TPA: hypothetical protein VFU02_18630 [Polyangiaceae bacterium]|nr:hypothetical protein [Polyangiaceae bacterium]
MGARSVLVLAELADAERSAVEEDCQSCNFEVTWLTSAETVGAKLISGRFDALVVHLQTPGAARACVEARKTLTRVRFPIMALADHVDDATFSKAFRVGVDDVIDLTASAQVSQRLAAIPRASWKPVVRSRGEALIVDPDNNRAEALARLLKEAGYLIKSARDEPSAKLHLWRQSIRLVVVDNSVQDTARWIKEGNSKEWHPIWIVRARPDQMDEISEQLYAFTNASAVNVYLGDADVLFEANRLSAAYESRRPPAARLFHGTTVTFSTGSSDTLDGQWIEHGSTYSIDLHEIAVRTLALPPSTELELSLTPPGHEAPLTLQAEVTQRRVFGAVQDQAAPPGFTARLSGENLGIWRDAIRAAGRQRFGPKWTASGEPVPAAQPSTAIATLAEPPPQSSKPSPSEPASSVEPTSPSPAGPPTPSSPPQDAERVNAEPPSSRPTSSKRVSSTPTSSTPDSPKLDVDVSEPPSTKPTSSKPTSSKPTSSKPDGSGPASSNPNRTSAPESGSVPIGRVRLVSAGAGAPGANRGIAPTLKSLHEEAAEALESANDSANDADVPLTTPSRERNFAEPETSSAAPASSQAGAAAKSAPAERPALEPISEPRSPAQAKASSSAAERRPQATPSTQARGKIVVLPTPATPAAEPAPPKRKVSWLTVVLLLAVVAGIAALASRRTPPRATPAPEPANATQAPADLPGPTSPSLPTPSAPPASPPAAPLGPAANEPGEIPSAAPTTSGSPAASAGATPRPPKDPTELAGNLGYLYVASPIDTQVFVQGKAAGKTNSYLEVFCGRRYLRLGTAPGEWQSDGVGFKIACQKVNQITLRPK